MPRSAAADCVSSKRRRAVRWRMRSASGSSAPFGASVWTGSYRYPKLICGVHCDPGSNITTADARPWPSVLACLILQSLQCYRFRSLVIASMTSELFVAELYSAACTTSTHCVLPELDAIFAEHRPMHAGCPKVSGAIGRATVRRQ